MQTSRPLRRARGGALASLAKKREKQAGIRDELQRINDEVAEALEGASSESGSESGAKGEGELGESDGSAEASSSELHANETDHLLDPDADEGSGSAHSYDCGLPHPVTVDREMSERNEGRLKSISGYVDKSKRLVIEVDSIGDNRGGRIKSTEKELTYFKSSKREFCAEEMLQGSRRIRISGINVLIGLDVSGSMSSEWTAQFKEIAETIEKLQETMDIEDVVFFTYNHALQEHSDSLYDLKLTARGGNAFAHVYQEILTELPLRQRNELILVTDCGDNLGFKLNDVAEVVVDGSESVRNHVSIIDTEGAGFYDRGDFNREEWSLFSRGDKDLDTKISDTISDLLT